MLGEQVIDVQVGQPEQNLVDPELRKKIIDAVLDLAEQLANTTNEFLRSTVESAGKALHK